MSNILGIIIGVVVTLVGFILLYTWWSIFVKGLMAVLPLLLILIGIFALVYFISEIKSKSALAKEEPPSAEEKKE